MKLKKLLILVWSLTLKVVHNHPLKKILNDPSQIVSQSYNTRYKRLIQSILHRLKLFGGNTSYKEIQFVISRTILNLNRAYMMINKK